MEKYQEVEHSIITTYRNSIWKKFILAICKYELIKDGDCIAVCISGGKDSMLMAKCFQELSNHGKKNFELRFLVMDPGYNEINRRTVERNAKILNVPIEIFESKIFDTVSNTDSSPCYLCAKMRRGYLYSHAKAMGCNKIALGHHFDDVIETIFMGIVYNGRVQTMMPKLHSTNFKEMELIRPLYFVEEASIINWRNYNKLSFIQCACKLTDSCSNGCGTISSKRFETKLLIRKLAQSNPAVAKNIFNCVGNINLDTVIGYKLSGIDYNFLDDYDKILTPPCDSDE
ncbi:MAG: tRNA 2-thiocytidine biosynthesis TtcA family protein [Christensenellaceae bacterium]|jgi:tRNA(Ile)-lysidine synthase TilS/MesJ|nr:tRNA 2-thiocytidine biosynthesis TtcA family protein [Christensenellaceae bacterium]